MEIRIAKGSGIDKVYALRYEVFVNEQNVPPKIELDDEDKRVWFSSQLQAGGFYEKLGFKTSRAMARRFLKPESSMSKWR